MNKINFLANRKANLLLKDNFSSTLTPKNLQELETYRSSPQSKIGWGVLDQLIVIECVLSRLSFIPFVK